MDNNGTAPTFEEVADFVRGWALIPVKQPITVHTQFERDLGITGDDGGELLQAAQEHFKVDLADGGNGYRKIFNLGDNEYLFNSEGFCIGSGGTDMITLFTNTNHSVRALTVGELCEAIGKAPFIG
jgi:flagellar basal body rod protein FlgG